jgi:hypothetical protein
VEAISAFLSLISTAEDIGIDKESNDPLGIGEWLAVIAGHPSLTKPGASNDPIVRLVLKAAVVNLEVRRPAGKWEKVAGGSYAHVVQGSEDEPPRGLGFEKIPSFTLLMQQNRDAMVFGRIGMTRVHLETLLVQLYVPDDAHWNAINYRPGNGINDDQGFDGDGWPRTECVLAKTWSDGQCWLCEPFGGGCVVMLP